MEFTNKEVEKLMIPQNAVRKTDTRSLARVLADDAVLDVGQITRLKNAAYKAGFAMAAAIVTNYVRDAERNNRIVSGSHLKRWAQDSRKWRNSPSMDDPPEVM